jgi:hypothetical protein
MTQKHLIPQVVIECVEKMLDRSINPNVRQNFEQRVEAIKKFCETALEQNSSKKRR